MDSAVVDLSGHVFSHSHYVALSSHTTRFTVHQGLENNISLNADVVKEMKRLFTERNIKMSLTFLYDVKNSSFKLLFQNVRSLNKHILDIQSDLNYAAAHLIIYVETKLRKDDSDHRFNLTGYVF
jgi:hypothetical protein